MLWRLKMNYILYNPLSGNQKIDKSSILKEELGMADATTLSLIDMNYNDFINSLKEDDKVIICGGDGTLNKSINVLYGKNLPCPFYYHASGTGNDFATDTKDIAKDGLVYLNDHLKNLPRVLVNGEEVRFINGIGFGIDGEACRVADEMARKGKENINYASISVNLLLFHFKKPKATVEVDGKVYHFKHVWLASSMKGKYYGGGMLIAPKQDRNSDTLTFVVLHRRCRLTTLIAFPSLFKGEHVNKKGLTTILQGKHIKVTFSHPMALQIDGETRLNVKEYEVFAQ